jgi:hypothetical protein
MSISRQKLLGYCGGGSGASGRRSISARLSCLVLAAVLCASAGCEILGLAASKADSGEDVPAAYKPAKVPTLVLAENWRDPSSVSMDAQSIEGFVVEDLRRHNAVPIANTASLEELRSSHPDEFHDRTLRQLGELASANQVIYINLASMNVSHAEGSEVWHGQAHAMVRVVDVPTGSTLWPPQSSDGFGVDAATSYMNNDQTQVPTEQTIRESLQRELADKVAELFYATYSDETKAGQSEDILNK